MSHEKAFAVWLVPGGAARERLRALIEALARETGGPAFAPHLTLVGGLRGDGGELAAKLVALGPALRPVELRMQGPAVGDAYHRCVFLDVARTEPLAGLRGAVQAALGAKDSAFRPHVSLVYGDLAAERRRAIAADPRVVSLGQEVCWAERLELWAVAGPVDRWACVAETAPRVS
ncbi:2'-5' RNA ligase family protein [Sorangium cellulosum]|nr:2'-5' RNA ligase family protein [Sorangium cellulosum]